MEYRFLVEDSAKHEFRFTPDYDHEFEEHPMVKLIGFYSFPPLSLFPVFPFSSATREKAVGWAEEHGRELAFMFTGSKREN